MSKTAGTNHSVVAPATEEDIPELLLSEIVVPETTPLNPGNEVIPAGVTSAKGKVGACVKIKYPYVEVLPAVTVLGDGKTEPVLEIVIVEPFVVKLYSVALTIAPPDTETVPADAEQLLGAGG